MAVHRPKNAVGQSVSMTLQSGEVLAETWSRPAGRRVRVHHGPRRVHVRATRHGHVHGSLPHARHGRGCGPGPGGSHRWGQRQEREPT
ncbi:uncharacterized protein ColSpa_12496 [Colletotrichum spaethianum]|uniref:Uncharacterized protein n=1 Tax=Colletotrichum spaethianum TaxID=700344 RepID=A0AA37PHV9_9PEZI|nr:uncharacterized protein ColSpa_12496 [Colletotrichum spaethianum]GKT52315.1 hypothetical protein ColSpa_12496 [Colletotrichum spaethianum]